MQGWKFKESIKVIFWGFAKKKKKKNLNMYSGISRAIMKIKY